MNALPDLIGLGLYTISDAARLAEVSPARVRGWVKGYPQRSGKHPAAVVGHLLPEIDGKTALCFRELIEVRFVRHFLRAGVSWRHIRLAAVKARQELLGEDGRQLLFSTDGVTIFVRTMATAGDQKARDLVANQYVMLPVLVQSFRSEFDLEGENVIRVWHPRPETPLVMLDPRRSFGHPIVEPGIPTRALVESLTAEGGDVSRVAALFKTSEESVQQAATFELTLAA